MTPQQEQQIRREAKKRGYNTKQTENFISFVMGKQSMTPQPQPEQQQKSGVGEFIKSTAKAVAKPFARVGASVANIVQGTGKAIKGDFKGAKEELDKSRTVLGVEAKPYRLHNDGAKGKISKFLPSAESALDVAGGAAEIASYATGTKTAQNVVQAGARGLIKQAAKVGAREGAISGGLAGFGNAAQDANPTLRKLATGTVFGTAAGAAGGAALGSAFAAINQGVKAFSNALSGRLSSAVGADKSVARRWAQELEKTNLRLTPSQKQQLGKRVDEVTDYILNNVPAGTPQKRYQHITQRYEDTEEVLQDFLTKTAKDRTVGKADLIARVEKMKGNYANERDVIAIEKQIDSMAHTLRRYDADIPLSRLNDLKRSTYKNAYNKAGDKVLDDVEHDFGDLLRQVIEESTDGLTVADGLDVATFNKQYGNIITAKRLLKIAESRNEVGLVGRLISAAMGGSLGTALGPGIGTAIGVGMGERGAQVLAGTAARSGVAKVLNRLK